MKYEIRVPTESNNELFSGPVVFREDGKAIPFCNAHGKGQACADELMACLGVFVDEDWSNSEELRKETSDDSMFETFFAEAS